MGVPFCQRGRGIDDGYQSVANEQRLERIEGVGGILIQVAQHDNEIGTQRVVRLQDFDHSSRLRPTFCRGIGLLVFRTGTLAFEVVAY